MLTVQSRLPSQALRPYVRAFAQRKADLPGAALVEPVPARLEQTLEFQFGDLFDVNFSDGGKITSPPMTVVGWLDSLRAEVRLCGAVESFAIFFQPGGFSQLFGVPINELRNQAFEAQSVLGPRVLSLQQRLGDSKGFFERVMVAESFLRGLLPAGAARDSEASAANRILSLRGMVGVDALARDARLSRRQFERRFLAEVGISPKAYARVARFQTALDMKVVQPGRKWIDTALDLGYFDQMHLVHDFKKLAGHSPERLLHILGDMRPKALAASGEIDRARKNVASAASSRVSGVGKKA